MELSITPDASGWYWKQFMRMLYKIISFYAVMMNKFRNIWFCEVWDIFQFPTPLYQYKFEGLFWLIVAVLLNELQESPITCRYLPMQFHCPQRQFTHLPTHLPVPKKQIGLNSNWYIRNVCYLSGRPYIDTSDDEWRSIFDCIFHR